MRYSLFTYIARDKTDSLRDLNTCKIISVAAFSCTKQCATNPHRLMYKNITAGNKA